MTNTKKAFKELYVNSHHNSVSAKMVFPVFYHQFKKWLGEVPPEIREEKLNVWIKRKHILGNLDTLYLTIPLKNRVLILAWGSGDYDPPNRIILGPMELLTEVGEFDIDWCRKHHELTREYNCEWPYKWEKEVWRYRKTRGK